MKEMNEVELQELKDNTIELEKKLDEFNLNKKGENPMQVILKGHLYIEHELRERLKKHLENPKILQCEKLKYSQLAKLVFSLGLLPIEIFDTVMEIDHLRNKCSQNLKYNFNEEEFIKLEGTFSPSFNNMYLEFLKSRKDPINELIKLQTVIFAIWQFISVYNIPEHLKIKLV